MKAPRWLRWVVSGILLALIVRVVDLEAGASLALSASPGLLALSLVIAVLDRLVMIGKWLPLLRVQLPGIGVLTAARAYFVSSLAGMFLPTSVGGDLLRALALGRGRGRVAEVTASIVAERVLGVASACVLGGLALAVAVEGRADLLFLSWWVVAGLAVTGAVLLAPLSRTVRRTVESVLDRIGQPARTSVVGRLGRAYATYRDHKTLVALVGLATVFEQLFPLVQFWILALALGVPVPVTVMVVCIPLTMLAARLPVSVGGLGVLEGSLVFLLGTYGYAPELAVALAVLYRLIVLAAVAPGVLFWTDLKGLVSGPSEAVRT